MSSITEQMILANTQGQLTAQAQQDDGQSGEAIMTWSNKNMDLSIGKDIIPTNNLQH